MVDGPPSRERSIERAHAVVRSFVRAAQSPAGEDPAGLVALLRHTLPSHFDFEERPGGFLDRLVGHGMSLWLADRLRDEHREFTDQLRELETRLSAGQDVTFGLTALADRLREHEWIEAMTGLRYGLLTPTDVPTDPSPSVQTLGPAVNKALEDVADHCRLLATGVATGDLLAAVTVSVPPHMPREPVLARLEDALWERGLDFVEITATVGPEIRLCGARFRHPGRFGPSPVNRP